MPNLSEHDNDPHATRGRRGQLMPILIVAVVVIFVVLHLTGVVGPGSH